MSVWENISTCYRGEALVRMAKHTTYADCKSVPGIWDYHLDPGEDMFPGVPKGNRKKLIAKGVDLSCDAEFTDTPVPYAQVLLATPKDVIVGVKACTTLFKNLKKIPGSAFGMYAAASVDHNLVYQIVENLALSSMLSPKAVARHASNNVPALSKHHANYNIAHYLKRLTQKTQLHSYKRELRETADLSAKDFRKNGRILYIDMSDEFPELDLPVAYFGGLYHIHFGKGRDVFVSLILTEKDIARVIMLLEASAAIEVWADAIGEEGDATKITLRKFMDWMLHMGDPNLAGEAWTSAGKVMKARLAGPLSVSAEKVLFEERKAKGFEDVLPYRDFVLWVTQSSIEGTFACISVGRLAIPPDYDVPGTFTKEKLLHRSKNPVGSEISAEAEADYKAFQEYNRWAFIKHYQAYKHMNPGRVKAGYETTDFGKKYTEGKAKGEITQVRKSEAGMIDLTGCLSYKSRDDDYHLYFKDTAMCPPTVSAALDAPNRPMHEKNQIAHLVLASERVDIARHKKNLASVDHPVRVGFKNEAAKVDGRLFFISTLEDKVVMAELEENITDFLKSVPGNAVGIPTTDLKSIMSTVSRENDDSGLRSFFLSDDISKWSPHMPTRVQQDSADFWAEVFDQPWIKDIECIQTHDSVVLSTLHWRASYQSGGANKEGQTGKRITYLMANLKSFAISKLREEGVVKTQAVLLTFLDDGLTKVDLPVATYSKSAKRVFDVMQQIQKNCGYELKLAKCYPSDRYLTFLNYEYYKGKRVYDDTKGLVKYFNKATGVIMSLPERIREAAAWGAGMCESSGRIEEVHLMYVIRTIREVQAWKKKKFWADRVLSLQFVSTPAVGGFGVVGIDDMASGTARAMFGTTMRLAREVASRDKSAVKAYEMLCHAEINPKSYSHIVRAPSTPNIALPHFSETRLTKAISDKMLEDTTSVYLSELSPLLSVESVEQEFAEILSSVKRISRVQLERIYKAHPVSYLDKLVSKVKKSSTLTSFLPPRKLISVERANMRDLACASIAWESCM